MRNKSMVIIFLGLAFAASMMLISTHRTSLNSNENTPSRSQTKIDTQTILAIANENLVVAPQDEQLILLLDLQPNRLQLPAEKSKAVKLITATALFYTNQYLSHPEYKTIATAEVHIVYVENMDEYNRANYSGMIRLGTLKFARDSGKITLVEDKIKFVP